MVPPRWRVARELGSAKVRRVVTLVDMGGGLDYGVHDSCVDNALRGVVERVFLVKDKVTGELVPPPSPEPGVFKRELAKFRGKLLHRVPPTPPVDRETFLEYYRGRKRLVYQRAVESLSVYPVERKDSYLSTFVKAEKINFTDKPDPAPRIIQPRSPRYNVEVGRYIKPQEHKIYAAIGRVFGEPVVAKGLNARARGRLIAEKWKRFKNPVAVGLDAARFDQHVRRDALEWEHSIYTKIAYSCSELARLLSWQIPNKGFVRCPDGVIKYKTNGNRMSGDMNTALGNVLIMCAMVYRYLELVEIDSAFIDDGDDCVVIFEREFLDRFMSRMAWFRGMGFTMKIEGVYDELEKIVFCQSQPVFDGEEWVMVRQPRAALSKDLISTKNCSTEGAWNFTRGAISACGLALTDGIPLMPSFYRMLSRGAVLKRSDELETGMDYLARGMEFEGKPVSDLARFSFYKAFGITPDEQIALEKRYDGITPTWSGLGPKGENFRIVTDQLVL